MSSLFSWLRPILLALALLPAMLMAVAQQGLCGAFYDQPPFTEKELNDVIARFPAFRTWTISQNEKVHPEVDNSGRPSFTYSPRVADYLKEQGTTAERFLCILGRAAAALAIIEEGDAVSGANRPTDMPPVTANELEFVRRNLPELLRATSDMPVPSPGATPVPPPAK